MALLRQTNGIGVEVMFTEYRYGYVYYGFRLLYGDAPLLNPAITNGDVFHCDESEKDSLIPFLERLLESDQPDEWGSLEPDIRIEAIPWHEIGWAEYQSGTTNIIHVSPRYAEALKKRDAERAKNGGKLADDYYNLTFLIDASNLEPLSGKNDGVYSGKGPGMRLTVTRKELQQFVARLKAEYAEFEEQHKDEFACRRASH